MKRVRVIPVICIDGPKMVKTVKFGKANYLGDPLNAIKIFNEKEVDEIVVLDITASKKNKEPNYQLVQEMAAECFMPLAYGGGIKNIEQARRLFSAGVEKVIVNTAIQNDLTLITAISSHYGSSSTVVSIDVNKNLFGKEKTFFKSATESGAASAEDFAKQCVEAGAGEILLTDVGRDGTFKGLNLELIKKVSALVITPVIACGGVNSLTDMYRGITAGASAIAAGSFFAYKNNDVNSILINYPSQEELKREIYSKLN